jgi:hypothetical protein
MQPRYPRQPDVPAALHQLLVFLSPGSAAVDRGGRASVVTAASSASISTSSNHFSAPAKSFGNKWLRNPTEAGH